MLGVFKYLALVGVLVSAPLSPHWVNCPESLEKWYRQGFSYQGEEQGKDYWKTPEETVKDLGGDCEDLGFLSKEILTRNGYNAYLFAMYGETGHGICVFQEKDGTWSVMDNLNYFPFKYSDWETILERHYTEYLDIYCCNQDKSCKKIYIVQNYKEKKND